MVTQQDIIDEVNRKSIDYNVTWIDIRRDADRAINKINSFLGTKYPSMSDVLDSPTSTYSFTVDEANADMEYLSTLTIGIRKPYFPDEHIYNVVVPFVCMELLANDEEFTTIYNKHAADLEDGLFTMFQKEFNRVPLAFRQDPDQGVFFASDSALGEIARNNEADLPVYKFKMYYHINNSDIVLGDIPFTIDTRAYLYEDTAFVKNWTHQLLSADGVWVYTFDRWTRDPAGVDDVGCAVGTEVTMITDMHYYAVWTKTCTLNNSTLGVLTIKDEYKSSLRTLLIPNIVDSNMVRTIPTEFLKSTNVVYEDADLVTKIELPEYITLIETNAFKGFNGDEIIFPETVMDVVNNTYEGIRINTGAFLDCPNLTGLILPTNIHTIEAAAIPEHDNVVRTIYCRLLEQNKPTYSALTERGWETGWYDESRNEVDMNYVANVVWGYNIG